MAILTSFPCPGSLRRHARGDLWHRRGRRKLPAPGRPNPGLGHGSTVGPCPARLLRLGAAMRVYGSCVGAESGGWRLPLSMVAALPRARLRGCLGGLPSGKRASLTDPPRRLRASEGPEPPRPRAQRRARPLLHQRCPVGLGPSLKTWPWWPPQRTQWYSVRGTISLKSRFVPMASGKAWVKLGQLVPLSYLNSLANRGRSKRRSDRFPAPSHR